MAYDQPIVRKPMLMGEKQSQLESLPEQLILPSGSKIPANEPIPVVEATTVKGLADCPVAGAVSINGKELLAMFIQNAKLFGVKPVVLQGYPEFTYTAEFDQMTWNLDKVAYSDLIAEMATQDRLERLQGAQAGERQRSDQAGSVQKGERREPTLTKERRSHFDGFQQHPVSSHAEANGGTEDGNEPDFGA